MNRTDQLDSVRVLVIALVSSTALGVCASVVSLVLASREHAVVACRALVAAHRLTELALFPSGQLVRSPAMRHRAVDLRQVPTLPSVELGAPTLLVESPSPGNAGSGTSSSARSAYGTLP
ncbi:hypothetical protein ACFL5O_09935 [Myxococcota bacterium]